MTHYKRYSIFCGENTLVDVKIRCKSMIMFLNKFISHSLKLYNVFIYNETGRVVKNNL